LIWDSRRRLLPLVVPLQALGEERASHSSTPGEAGGVTSRTLGTSNR
jgi:hypothetical protein